MSDIFRFKRFEVDQKGCAMKINTDGVLLGALAAVDRPTSVLDIGTGTGVIALMLAQRFPEAKITAIEIDNEAARTACRNFSASPFATNISCHRVALEDFETTCKYDLIVTNPPYFLHSLTNQDVRKRIARHTEMSFFDALLARSAVWLSPRGSVQLILPPATASQIQQKALAQYGMVKQWEVAIHSFPGGDPVRKILALGMEDEEIDKPHTFVIYERRGQYSAVYRQLLKDFFIAF